MHSSLKIGLIQGRSSIHVDSNQDDERTLFRRFRKTCGDEAEHIAFPNHMDDVEQPVLGRQADARLPCLFLRAGVLIASQRIKKCLSSLLEPNAMLEGIAGSFVAVPDKPLPIQGREHIHIAIVYTRVDSKEEGISDLVGFKPGRRASLAAGRAIARQFLMGRHPSLPVGFALAFLY